MTVDRIQLDSILGHVISRAGASARHASIVQRDPTPSMKAHATIGSSCSKVGVLQVKLQ